MPWKCSFRLHLPTLSGDLQAMKVMCPMNRSGQPWKLKPHLSLMAIKRTGGGLAGKEAWKEGTDIGSLILASRNVVYTVHPLGIGHCARHRLICASQWLSELGILSPILQMDKLKTREWSHLPKVTFASRPSLRWAILYFTFPLPSVHPDSQF